MNSLKVLSVFLLLNSFTYYSFQKAFALCFEESGNLLIYCRGQGGIRQHGYYPDWYNQPLEAIYLLAFIGLFIAMLAALLYFLKYNESQKRIREFKDETGFFWNFTG